MTFYGAPRCANFCPTASFNVGLNQLYTQNNALTNAERFQLMRHLTAIVEHRSSYLLICISTFSTGAAIFLS